MTEQELARLIAEGEGPYLEFKAPGTKPATLARTLVAFANTGGGRVIIGIDDTTRQPTGIPDGEATLDSIYRAASLDCCQPAVSISVEERTYQGQSVFVVTVPYQPREMFTTNGRVLIRRGGENVPAASYEITALASRRGQLHYEAEVPPAATLDDLDLSLLEAYRATYEKKRGRRLTLLDLKLLEHLGAVVYREGELRPTVAGLLVFGREVWRLIPQSRLSIVRYPGLTITRNILDAREFEGRVPDLIDRATDYLGERMQVGAIRDARRFGPRREDVPEYPLPALRELITNALAHREYQIRGARVLVKWFSDRLEVSNPGDLMEPITPATIYTTRPVHRNPSLMKMLYGYGYVEGYGDGLPMVRALIEEHPLRPPLPRIEEVPGSVVVTLYAADLSKLAGEERAARWAEQGLNERQIAVMTFLAEHGQIATRECRALLGVSERTARTELSRLATMGLVVARGQGRNRHYTLP
ncbi:MAG: RNA-binding domain-containing protein [Anaerolineae bacterium]